MKKFRCHKEVHAKPMTRGEYNHYRGWEIPANENPHDDGYLVVYSRGTVDHYESWSPKKQFDEGYTELTQEGLKVVSLGQTKTEETYLDRLNKEYDELQDKATKLYKFLDSDKKGSLSVKDVQLLVAQLRVMVEYLSILEARLGFDDEEEDF